MNNMQKENAQLEINFFTRYFAPKILKTRSFICDCSSSVELHHLSGRECFLLSMWCLKSFYYYSKTSFCLIIHDDGTLTPQQKMTFRQHFEKCRIIEKTYADNMLAKVLNKYPYCFEYRLKSRNCLSLKLFDCAVMSKTKKFIFIDSDILFFKKPISLLKKVLLKHGCFLSDIQNSYCHEISQKLAFNGVKILPRINTGLFFCPDTRFLRLEMLEHLLKHLSDDVNIGWKEQTSLAYLFSLEKKYQRLGNTYQVAQKTDVERLVCNHFVTGMRERFYVDGLKKLKRNDFLERIGFK